MTVINRLAMLALAYAVLISAGVSGPGASDQRERVSGPAAGQKTGGAKQGGAGSPDSRTTRSMFVEKKADGLEVKVKQRLEGGFELVDPGKAFKTGDEIRLNFLGNYEGYVYFINIPPKRETKVIYKKKISPDDSIFDLPDGQEVMVFKDDTGVEILKVIMTKSPIAVFDRARSQDDGKLGAEAKRVLDELNKSRVGASGTPKRDQQTSASQPVGVVEGRCRGLELAIGKDVRCRGLAVAPASKTQGGDKKEEGIVVAIKDKQGFKLNEGDIAVFDLRFKHVPR